MLLNQIGAFMQKKGVLKCFFTNLFGLMFPREAFILAGGKGERLRPLTDTAPKPMILVQGKPIVQYGIEQLISLGVKKIVLGVSYKAEKIKEYFGNGKNFGAEIFYSVENGFLGTGGALKYAKALIEGKFVMLNGDTLMNIDFKKMNNLHEEKNAAGTIALVSVKDVSSYGVARLDGDKIAEFVEKPQPKNAPSNWVNTGAYILDKSTIEMLPGEFNLIEKTLFPKLAESGKLYGFRHFGQWFPTDDTNRLKKAEAEWNWGRKF